MAKDFTKYKLEDLGESYSKARLVQKVLEIYLNNFQVNYSELKEIWFDGLQGGKGVIRLVSEIDDKNERNYYVDAPIQLLDGSKIVICNQWGKDNLSNFILQAGLLGFKIIPESVEENTNEELKEKIEKKPTVEENTETVFGSPNWEVPHAIAFVIRHTIFADDEVHDGEIETMKAACEEFEENGINVREVWDLVDDQAELYRKMGWHDTMLLNCINFMNNNFDDDDKKRFLQILMMICAVDNVIKHGEYTTLILIAKTFFPGREHLFIDQTYENAGIKIIKE